MDRSVGYLVRVRVHGQLDPAWWSDVFAGIELSLQPDGTTDLSGAVRDQAALHGLLAAIRDLGLSLISVETVAQPASGSQA